MHTGTNDLKRDVDSWIELINAIELIGPGDFVGPHAPGETAGPTELLRLREKCCAATKFLFNQFSARDIGCESDHAKRLTLVIEKHLTVRCQPMEAPVRPFDAKLRPNFPSFMRVFDGTE